MTWITNRSSSSSSSRSGSQAKRAPPVRARGRRSRRYASIDGSGSPTRTTMMAPRVERGDMRVAQAEPVAGRKPAVRRPTDPGQDTTRPATRSARTAPAAARPVAPLPMCARHNPRHRRRTRASDDSARHGRCHHQQRRSAPQPTRHCRPAGRRRSTDQRARDTGEPETGPTAPCTRSERTPAPHTPPEPAGCPRAAPTASPETRRGPPPPAPPATTTGRSDAATASGRARSHQIPDHPEHAGAPQLLAQILNIQVRVDLLRRLHRAVRDQLADHLKRHPSSTSAASRTCAETNAA